MKLIVGVSISIFLTIICFACGGNPAPETETAETETMMEQPDTLSQWVSWAESSDDGLWAGEDRVRLIHLDKYTGDESGIYFNPSTIAYHDGYIYVADQNQETIICMDASDKQNTWQYGEPGEGPGHFSGIGHIAVSDSSVFVGNMQNGRIEIFSRDGDYQGNLALACPYDMAIISDSLLAVASIAEGDLITLINIRSNEKFGSFGEWQTDLETNIMYSNKNLFVCVLGDSLLAVASFYESNVRIFNIYTEEMVSEFYRTIPFTIEPNDPGMFRIHIVDICAYNDSILCVALAPVTHNRMPINQDNIDELAEITVYDRYSLDGEYLDSFIIPENCGGIVVDGDEMVVANFLDSSISRYKIE